MKNALEKVTEKLTINHDDDIGFKIHVLKTHGEYFCKVWLGYKPWEVRLNDRDYVEGDVVILYETDTNGLPLKVFDGKLLLTRVLAIVMLEKYAAYMEYMLNDT